VVAVPSPVAVVLICHKYLSYIQHKKTTCWAKNIWLHFITDEPYPEAEFMNVQFC
jgi:hypothetical protein